MANVSITAANVLASSSAKKIFGVSGSALTQGAAVYLDANNRFQPANATTSATTAKVVGFVQDAVAAALQPCVVVTADAGYTPGFTAAIGNVVYLSGTDGAMTVTSTDVQATGYYVSVLGVMITTTTMNASIVSSTGIHA